MNKPLITVIMQNYNVNYWNLQVALDSVINQTFKEFSFVFIDDWSTDYEIDKIFDEIREKWNKIRPNMPLYLVKKPQSGPFDEKMHNHGHSFCRNWGLELVRMEKLSDFVFFADSDDELMPNCLEILWENMQKDPEIDISIGNFTRDEVQWCKFKVYYNKTVNENDIIVQKTPMIVDNYRALYILCDPYMIPGHRMRGPSVAFCATWNKIFRLSLFDRVHFPNNKLRDDNFTAHRLLFAARKIAFTPEFTYFYSLDGKLSGENLYKTIDIVEAHQDRVQFFTNEYDIHRDYKCQTLLYSLEEFEHRQLVSNIVINEHMVYLHTLMQVYKDTLNDKDKDICLDEFKYCILLWQKELMLREPQFLKICLKWQIERNKECNE